MLCGDAVGGGGGSVWRCLEGGRMQEILSSATGESLDRAHFMAYDLELGYAADFTCLTGDCAADCCARSENENSSPVIWKRYRHLVSKAMRDNASLPWVRSSFTTCQEFGPPPPVVLDVPSLDVYGRPAPSGSTAQATSEAPVDDALVVRPSTGASEAPASTGASPESKPAKHTNVYCDALAWKLRSMTSLPSCDNLAGAVKTWLPKISDEFMRDIRQEYLSLAPSGDSALQVRRKGNTKRRNVSTTLHLRKQIGSEYIAWERDRSSQRCRLRDFCALKFGYQNIVQVPTPSEYSTTKTTTTTITTIATTNATTSSGT